MRFQRIRKAMLLAGALVVATATVAASAANDIFLKVEGGGASGTIEGETTVVGREKQIEVDSFSWGISNAADISTGSGGLRGGKPNLSQLTMAKATDKSTPGIMKAVAAGTRYDKITLDVTKPLGRDRKPTAYLTIELRNAVFTSYEIAGSDGSDQLPFESIMITYEAFRITYFPMTAEGTLGTKIEGAWNRVKNTPTFDARSGAVEAPVASGTTISVKQN